MNLSNRQEEDNKPATMQLNRQWLTGSLTSGISIWKEITGSEV